MAEQPSIEYITYIAASAERVWDALTSEELSADFWGHANVSDWRPGSRWEHRRTDGSGIADVVGEVVRSQRPHTLALTFGDASAPGAPVPLATFTIEEYRDIVELTIRHEHLPSEQDAEAARLGWASVASNLKSLLETGRVLPQAPWEMHADLRDAQMARNDPE